MTDLSSGSSQILTKTRSPLTVSVALDSEMVALISADVVHVQPNPFSKIAVFPTPFCPRTRILNVTNSSRLILSAKFFQHGNSQNGINRLKCALTTHRYKRMFKPTFFSKQVDRLFDGTTEKRKVCMRNNTVEVAFTFKNKNLAMEWNQKNPCKFYGLYPPIFDSFSFRYVRPLLCKLSYFFTYSNFVQ